MRGFRAQSKIRHGLALLRRPAKYAPEGPVVRCPECGMEVVLTEAARRLLDEGGLQCPSRSCRYTFRRAW